MTFTADSATVCDLHLNHSATNCSEGQMEIFASNEENIPALFLTILYQQLCCVHNSESSCRASSLLRDKTIPRFVHDNAVCTMTNIDRAKTPFLLRIASHSSRLPISSPTFSYEVVRIMPHRESRVLFNQVYPAVPSTGRSGYMSIAVRRHDMN